MMTQLLVALVLACAGEASAQTSADELGLMQAAARYVATTLIPGKSSAFETTGGHARGPDAIAEARVTDSVVAQALGAERYGALNDLLSCPSGPPSCDFHGVDAIVRIGPLKMRADTGFVAIKLIERRASSKGPYVIGGRAQFVRRDGAWTLVWFGFNSQS